MNVTTRKGKVFVKPDGNLTVAKAEDFKKALLRSIEKGDTIEINLSKIDSIDLACMQLLCSAHRTAESKGKTLVIKEPYPPLYLEARKLAGFMYLKQCKHVKTEHCLWVGGDE